MSEFYLVRVLIHLGRISSSRGIFVSFPDQNFKFVTFPRPPNLQLILGKSFGRVIKCRGKISSPPQNFRHFPPTFFSPIKVFNGFSRKVSGRALELYLREFQLS